MRLRSGVVFGIFLVLVLSSCQPASYYDDTGNGDTGDGDTGNGDNGNGDTGNGDTGNGDTGNGDASDAGNGDSGTEYAETDSEEVQPPGHDEMGEDTGCYWDVLWQSLVDLSDTDASDEEVFVEMCRISCQGLNPPEFDCPPS